MPLYDLEERLFKEKMNIEQHTPPKRLRRPGRTSNIEF